MSRGHIDRIRAGFDRAAPRYEEAAVLQREVTSRLLERLQYIKDVRRSWSLVPNTAYCVTSW